MIFQTNYDEIEVKKSVMTLFPVTSSLLCHRKMSPK